MKKFLALLLLITLPVHAQDMGGIDMSQPTAEDDAGTGMSMHGAFGAYGMNRDSSGTSWQPDIAPAMGGMAMSGGWMLMKEARVTGILDSQSGPRGDSQAFASGMGMLMAQKDLENRDTLGLRAMLSIDPLMGRRGYPLLLQNGETADGVTHLVDRQHPHDLFMELAGTYSHPLSQTDSVFLYAGYPGEPALGPSAYMHRVSGMDNPETPITHHWLDSTHITYGVVTAGWVHDDWKLEASQFTGREPDQFRFDFDPARFDSTSLRLSFNPDPSWSLQISGGFLKSPEALTPSINEQRLTASATYDTPLDDEASLAVTLAFGNKHLSDGTGLSAGLIEAAYKPSDPWTIFARAEALQSDELTADDRVHKAGKIALGAVHDWELADHLKLGLGGVYDFDFAPRSGSYGGGPHGAIGFLRLIAD
ncbi:MAG TPA: hypothetical protein VG501_03330 [Rhizomicrobium sp.]|nr:hypothetical protein [Rhizomicrobium sp.]